MKTKLNFISWRKVLCMTIFMSLFMCGLVSASGNKTLFAEPELDEASVEVTKYGNKIYDVKNIEDFERVLGEDIKEVKYLEIPKSYSNRSASINSDGDKLTNIHKFDSFLYISQKQSSKLYNGSSTQTTLTKSISFKFSNTFNTSVGLKSGVVSSQLGISVDNEVTIADSVTVEVSPNSSKTIDLYPTARHYEFNIADSSGENVGYGEVNEVIGVCIVVR